MLNICPSFSAAPRTLHKVLTILSALASDRNGLESITAFFPEGKERKLMDENHPQLSKLTPQAHTQQETCFSLEKKLGLQPSLHCNPGA